MIYAARERHSSVRYNSLGYPQRCIRQGNYLLIWNLKPERWPAGPPTKLGGNAKYPTNGEILSGKVGDYGSAFHDVDHGPSLWFLVENREKAEVKALFNMALGFRPEFELYDLEKDQACLKNLAANPELRPVFQKMLTKLQARLKEDKDPRVMGNGDIWETYPRESELRWFPVPQWAKDNPEKVPSQPWIEQRRPK